LLKWRKDYAHTYCSKCWAKKICNICWLHVLDAEGKIKEKVFSKCAEEKTRLERLITIYIRLKQIDSNIFAILRDRASQNLKKGTTT